MIRRLTPAIVALVFAVGGCAGGDPPTASPEPVASAGDASDVTFPKARLAVTFGERSIRAEQAVTSAQQARGLMHRGSLRSDDGMIFLFQRLQNGGFHMKDTLVPLSIAYMRRTGQRSFVVVSIKDMAPCPPSAVSCPTHLPDAYYDAALEVNQGWYEDAGVEVGSTAEVEGAFANPFDEPFVPSSIQLPSATSTS